MGSETSAFSEKKESLADKILSRANTASAKVQERVKTTTLPNLEEMGSMGQRWLSGLQNDFYALVENPNDPCGAGNYKGWTPDEIRELYSVLYGEDMDS